MAVTVVNFLMESLKQLISCKIDLILEEKDQIESLYKELGLLRTFLKDRDGRFYQHEEVKNLETRIRDVAYEAENTIDLFIVNAVLEEDITMMKKEDIGMAEEIGCAFDLMMKKTNKKDIGMAEKIGRAFDLMTKKKKDIVMAEAIGHVFVRSLNLDHVKQDIEAITTELMKIYDIDINEMGTIQVGNSSHGDSSRANITTWEEETMVGFDNEAMIIKEQLTRGPKQLQVVSIVGMAGLGKTTLARKVYNDPLVVYHFHIRAWIYVSPEYQKRDLLLHLLSSVTGHKDGIDQTSNEKLAEQLYKRLKGRIYFIVMDDIWDSRTWVDLKIYLPNDNNGSRILFTSQLESVALHANSPPLPLRFLSHDESWDLLRQKVFRRETCHPELTEIGKQIATKCQGLPLAIVVVAGILANEETRRDRWKQVGETINSWTVGDPQLWMRTIELSYNHLPQHLKLCFLYFAAFPKDFQIPVRKLIWLWVAEGFIRKIEGKSMEDVAEEYLMDLVGRSLVLVFRRRYDGAIKNCGIHDLLRDFCLKKAEEVYFLKQILYHQHFSSSPSTSKHFSGMRCLCIHPAILGYTSLIPSALNTRSFLSIASGSPELFLPQLHFQFKLLRVLDISSMKIFRYPNEIEQLVLLRYLAFGTLCLYSNITHIPDSISKLWNLETLILGKCSSGSLYLAERYIEEGLFVALPQCIRKMVKLRHLYLTGVVATLEIGRQDPNARYPFSLDNLQTLSWVNPWSWQDFLATPNLRTLGFRGHMVDGGYLMLPHLDFLHHLRKLKLFNTDPEPLGTLSWPNNLKLPTNLKKLTLLQTYIKWDEMSTLGKLLPNLESLKLLKHACRGKSWETSDGEFPRLKFLKIVSFDIEWWDSSSNHFPSLQRLVLFECFQLERIPFDIGYIPTLQMIEIHWCNPSIANSAKEIKEEQESMGNNSLQIIESHN